MGGETENRIMAARPAPPLWLRQNQSVIRRKWLYAGTGVSLPEKTFSRTDSKKP